jgi:hypothetical protein
MRAVDEGRQEQIRSKNEAFQKEKQEGGLFAKKFLDEASEAIRRYYYVEVNIIFNFI